MQDELTPAGAGDLASLIPQPLSARSPSTPGGWRRPALVALVVLVCGAALGAAGFAAERYYFVWDPPVTATSDGGWRISGGAALRPVAPVIAGDRLVWGQGPYTCVLELDSGDTHVVGVAPRRTSIWPPAAGDRYVAWIEAPRDSAGRPAILWVYDAERGRRQRFAVGADAATSAVAGDLVAWFEKGAPPRVMSIDMRTGERSVLAEGEGLDYPVLGGDGVVGWLDRDAHRGPAAVVKDLAKGTLTAVRLAAAGSGVTVGDIHLGGRTLVWSLESASGTSVIAADVDSGSHTMVAVGQGSAPATDGRVVVWVAGDASTGAPTVVARRLDGGVESMIGRPAAWPEALAVGGGRVAWLFDDGVRTVIETTKAAPR